MFRDSERPFCETALEKRSALERAAENGGSETCPTVDAMKSF